MNRGAARTQPLDFPGGRAADEGSAYAHGQPEPDHGNWREIQHAAEHRDTVHVKVMNSGQIRCSEPSSLARGHIGKRQGGKPPTKVSSTDSEGRNLVDHRAKSLRWQGWGRLDPSGMKQRSESEHWPRGNSSEDQAETGTGRTGQRNGR